MKSCSTCRFFYTNKFNLPHRQECHRLPPIAIDKAQHGGLWPETEVWNFCGEYRRWPLWRVLRRFIARLIWKPQPNPSDAAGREPEAQGGNYG